MGRKNRVQKQSKDTSEPEPEEEPVDEISLALEEQDRQYMITDQMLRVLDALRSYRSDCSLPMIEYLDEQTFLEFTDYVTGED